MRNRQKQVILESLRDAQRLLKRVEVGGVNDDMVREGRAGELERFIWLVDREIRMWSGGEVFVFAPGKDGVGGDERKLGKVLLDEGFGFTSNPFPTLDDTSTAASVAKGREEEEAIPTVNLDSITPGAEGGQLIEFQRTPNALVWLVHDPFLRLIVHCLARVSRCPSFSKDDVNRPGLRFTWILNRNPMARRSRRGRRVSVSSSAMSVNGAAPAVALGGIRPAMRLMAGAMETPPRRTSIRKPRRKASWGRESKPTQTRRGQKETVSLGQWSLLTPELW